MSSAPPLEVLSTWSTWTIGSYFYRYQHQDSRRFQKVQGGMGAAAVGAKDATRKGRRCVRVHRLCRRRTRACPPHPPQWEDVLCAMVSEAVLSPARRECANTTICEHFSLHRKRRYQLKIRKVGRYLGDRLEKTAGSMRRGRKVGMLSEQRDCSTSSFSKRIFLLLRE